MLDLRRFAHPIIPFSAAFLLLGACVTSEGLLLAEEPGYAAGFADGCTTSNEENKSFSTKKVRDQYQFDADRAYRAGWRQGYLECGETYREPDNGGRILGERNEY